MYENGMLAVLLVVIIESICILDYCILWNEGRLLIEYVKVDIFHVAAFLLVFIASVSTIYQRNCRH